MNRLVLRIAVAAALAASWLMTTADIWPGWK
jgi:hypothetical protein